MINVLVLINGLSVIKEGNFICESLTSSIYEELSEGLLGGFYCEILKNIENGILSEMMYAEIDLIKHAAFQKGIPPEELYQKGLAFIQQEEKVKVDGSV